MSLLGNNVYKETFERTYELIDQSVDDGLDASIFGPLLDQIINSSSVARIYRVGKPLEKVSVFLKRLLPIGLYERMIRNHYKM